MREALPFAVFDWNGTLLDDVDAWVEGCNAALSVFGHDARSLPEWQELYTCPIIHSYEKAGVPIDLYLQKADMANAAFYQAYQNATADGFKLRKGARALLEKLKQKGYHITILSNHRHDLLRLEIENTGLSGFFDHICGNLTDSDIAHKLTKTERLKAYLGAYNVDGARSFIIGDSHEEPYVGRAVQIPSISITGGYVSEGRLAHAKPGTLVHQLDNVLID